MVHPHVSERMTLGDGRAEPNCGASSMLQLPMLFFRHYDLCLDHRWILLMEFDSHCMFLVCLLCFNVESSHLLHVAQSGEMKYHVTTVHCGMAIHYGMVVYLLSPTTTLLLLIGPSLEIPVLLIHFHLMIVPSAHVPDDIYDSNIIIKALGHTLHV